MFSQENNINITFDLWFPALLGIYADISNLKHGLQQWYLLCIYLSRDWQFDKSFIFITVFYTRQDFEQDLFCIHLFQQLFWFVIMSTYTTRITVRLNHNPTYYYTMQTIPYSHVGYVTATHNMCSWNQLGLVHCC